MPIWMSEVIQYVATNRYIHRCIIYVHVFIAVCMYVFIALQISLQFFFVVNFIFILIRSFIWINCVRFVSEGKSQVNPKLMQISAGQAYRQTQTTKYMSLSKWKHARAHQQTNTHTHTDICKMTKSTVKLPGEQNAIKYKSYTHMHIHTCMQRLADCKDLTHSELAWLDFGARCMRHH